METFPAQYFRYSVQYPNSGIRIQLGRSYQFDTPPEAPDQRVIILKVQGMQYFLDAAQVLTATPEPERNLLVLENFYTAHRLAKSFLLNHPIYGAIECKFNRPLNIPEGIAGGNGTVPEFDVELIEIP